jgi:hypothetical protein
MMPIKAELWGKRGSIVKLRWLICIALVAVLAGIAGCRQAPELRPDTFTATYTLEDGRSYSISGRSKGMPGEKLDYILKINANTEGWQDEYYVLLIDSDSIIQENSHDQFNIPGSGGFQKPIIVKFPEGYEGALGLCIIIPQNGRLTANLSAGVKNAIAPKWPDITYPIHSSEPGNLKTTQSWFGILKNQQNF